VTLRVAVAGAGGRMGQALIEATLAAEDLVLAAALEVTGSAAVGADAGARLGARTGIEIATDLDAALGRCDVLVDFTRPEGTLVHAAGCARRGVALVSGTTGLSDAQKAELAGFATAIPIVFSPSMSVGVNVMRVLVERAAASFGADYDVEILEMHHKHKVDAPSGTALMLGEAVAHGLGTTLAAAAVPARQGHTGERRPGSIGFAALRGGDVVGEHTVIFAGEGERFEIVHRSGSRRTYAAGAMRAVRFAAAARAAGRRGLFGMAEVLGLA
jgi:4-hydroxy-tetrahydrodipicolinate reductase